MKTTVSYQTMTEAIRAELMRLSNPELKGKALTDEIARATAMAYLAQSIVNLGKFELFEIGVSPDTLLISAEES